MTTENKYTADNFWDWFKKNQHRFDQTQELNAEEAPARLNEIMEELKNFDPWLKALIGRYDDETSELVLTADGDIAMFVKVEQLVDRAPALPGWRFTAHKPPLGFDEISIEMHDKVFDHDHVKFYPVEQDAYPDLVNIIFTHSEYDQQQDEDFQTAGSIYVQNALGELNTATQIDHYNFGPEPDDKSILIPVTKLSDYLSWREKEFVEKYDQAQIEVPEEMCNTIEGRDSADNVMMAIAVSSFENWEFKPVFCWWVRVEMEYTESENGLPDQETLQQLHETEDKAVRLLTADPSIIFTASKTYRGCRTIYFYAQNYHKPSALLYEFCERDPRKFNLGFFIERDKYWQNMEEFYNLEEEEE